MSKSKIKTKWWAIVLVILSTFLTALASFFLKLGANKFNLFPLNIISLITNNYFVLLGIFLYVITAAVFIFAFKYGELTVLFPIFSLSFAWVLVISKIALGEPLTIIKIVGIVGIMIGVSIIGMSDRMSSIKRCEQ
ncbi:hypothetical protein HN587_01410 [Candidatus Woesearchaeota archaeon]|jgi:drug/metabolite transporter (DMT)-like permease|nr:hypothetical protein [Candidatus Woesearchaeota archaeon]